MRSSLAAFVIAAAAAGAAADSGLPPGQGVVAPDGSRFTTEIAPAGDVDDYVFRGYPEMPVTASARSRSSTLTLALTLIRPDGSPMTEEEGASVTTRGRTTRCRAVLDATGWWKVRVRSSDTAAGGGPYTLTIGTRALPALTLPERSAPGLSPDANGQFRFELPAIGGATLAYRLVHAGGTPTFRELTDPRGVPVPGVAGGTRLKRFRLPEDLPQGAYLLVFDAAVAQPTSDVRLEARVSLPPAGRARRARLAAVEPTILESGVDPVVGGPGTLVTVRAARLVDPAAPKGDAGLLLGHVPLDGVTLSPDGESVSGRVPPGIPDGVHDVVVESTSGQRAARAAAFTHVPPPVVDSVEPSVGPTLGEFEITLRGRNFRPGSMGLLFDGVYQPVLPVAGSETATSVRFVMPPHEPALLSVSVVDRQTGLADPRRVHTFLYTNAAAIGRVVPAATPTLGGDPIDVRGANFGPDDHVFLERAPAGAGLYDEISATETTYVSPTLHRFVAPVRPPGTYRVHVQSVEGQPDPPRTRDLVYFSFADVSEAAGLDAVVGSTSAAADLDLDGDDDLLVAQRGGPALAGASLTRVLRNDDGAFTDVTASVLTPALADDDWRADRVWAADVTADGWPDVLLVTDSSAFPPTGRSHLRIFVNELRTATAADTDRVLRDRTIDLAPPARWMTTLPWSGDGITYVADDWRGLDLWVGDLDPGASGPPSILLTRAETTEDIDVSNAPYGGSPYPAVYPFRFYWGGSRRLTWDAQERGGRGRWRFDANFFPRASGIAIPIYGAPPGIDVGFCNAAYGKECRGTFTPFTGQRVAAGDLDGDGRFDVAVVADAEVRRDGATISSLQVALAGLDASAGTLTTDVTHLLTSLGGDLRGDAVAIGRTNHPAGDTRGLLAVARAAPVNGQVALRLFAWDRDAASAPVVEDVSDAVLPVDAVDRWQAAALRFLDFDGDDDDDLVLVAPASPGDGLPAFRVLRSETVGGDDGVLVDSLRDLVTPLLGPSEHLAGEALALGDIDGDTFADFLVTGATGTRAIRVER